MSVYFILDDSELVPPSIRNIISVDRFGEIVRRHKLLSTLIEEAIQPAEGLEIRSISNADERRAVMDELAMLRRDDKVFRLPTAIMPVEPAMFTKLVQKLPFGLDQVVFEVFDDDAATFLCRDEAISVLRAADNQSERRVLMLGLRDHAISMSEAVQFTDLRQVRHFLAFMTGATETRHFNELKVEDGVYTKASTDKAKMKGEHDFFHIVPPAMKRFLIPTFDYQDRGDTASYAMELMAIPDGALQIVHHSFDPAGFELLLDRFFAYIASRQRIPASKAEVRAAAERETVLKLEQRLSDFAKSDLGAKVDAIFAQSGAVGGMAAMCQRANQAISAAMALDTSDHLAISHGDPCLSNILFSKELGIFRLIDPRGGSALEDVAMHPVYDIAKLSHSLLGGYDFINNGMFECGLDERLNLKLTLDGGGPAPFIREAFSRRLGELGYNLRLVRAVEMTLFLSMLPLHLDVPRKLPAFCLTALSILEELESGL